MIRVRVAPGVLVADATLTLAGDEHTYVAYARRAAVGDALELFDGGGAVAAASIASIAADHTQVVVGAVRLVPAAGPSLTSLLPLIKGDRMDEAIAKLVEVGVDRIVTYDAARAVVRLDGDRVADRVRRWNVVAGAAARQAGRAIAPAVSAPVGLAQIFAELPADVARWVAVPTAEAPPRWPDAATAGVLLTGPEGGLTAEELAAARLAGFVPVRLGPFVLRAETAPAVAVALLRAATP